MTTEHVPRTNIRSLTNDEAQNKLAQHLQSLVAMYVPSGAACV